MLRERFKVLRNVFNVLRERFKVLRNLFNVLRERFKVLRNNFNIPYEDFKMVSSAFNVSREAIKIKENLPWFIRAMLLLLWSTLIFYKLTHFQIRIYLSIAKIG